MSDLDVLYKTGHLDSHAAGLRAVYDAGFADGVAQATAATAVAAQTQLEGEGHDEAQG